VQAVLDQPVKAQRVAWAEMYLFPNFLPGVAAAVVRSLRVIRSPCLVRVAVRAVDQALMEDHLVRLLALEQFPLATMAALELLGLVQLTAVAVAALVQ
jgi:hypothetical protein